MRISRPALEQVREYAAVRGCTELDLGGRRFIAPDKSRVIRVREIQRFEIYLWDSAAGIISIGREGRSTKIKGRQDRPEAQIDKGLPDVVRERELKPIALAGQLILKI